MGILAIAQEARRTQEPPLFKLTEATQFATLLAGLFFMPASLHAELFDPTVAIGNVDAPYCMSSDPLTGWGPVAGCQVQATRGGHPFSLRFNKQSLRGPDYSAKPARGTVRILLVGSSMYLGPGIGEEFTPAALLEKELRARGRKVEVINASEEGYTVMQLALKLDQWTKAYAPDLVLLNLNGPTFMIDQILASISPSNGRIIPETVNIEPTRVLPSAVQSWFWNKPARLRKIAAAFIYFTRRLEISRALAKFQDESVLAREWSKVTMAAVDRVRLLASQRKFRLFVFLDDSKKITNEMSVPPNLDFFTANLIDHVTPALMMSKAAVYDLLDQRGVRHFTIQFPLDAALFIGGDNHLNEKGSQFLANELARFQDQYLPARR
ncbi:MAG: SGNH/GDSL hydrolase family protein [Bdellovibrionota bacterium]